MPYSHVAIPTWDIDVDLKAVAFFSRQLQDTECFAHFVGAKVCKHLNELIIAAPEDLDVPVLHFAFAPQVAQVVSYRTANQERPTTYLPHALGEVPSGGWNVDLYLHRVESTLWELPLRG